MINFQCKYGFKEFAITHIYLTCQSKILKIVFAVILLINLATLFIQVKTRHHITLENIADFFLPFIILLMIFIISPVVQFRRFKEKTISLQIKEQSIKSKMDTISSEIGWDNISKVTKIGDMLGFFYTRNCAILLPLRLVNDSEKQAIRQLCEQKNITTKF